jgi:ABC-2 type transport system ATP-binding protein
MAGLVEHKERKTGGLPLGWKQRLALGCAVLHQPPLLFLDEPTSGVDPSARRRFWDLINDLARDGTTVLVSTHYMEEAEYCNRMVLMNRGRVVAVDAPSGLRDRMTDPLFEISTTAPPKAVDALGREMGVREAAMFGRRVHAVIPAEVDGAELIRHTLQGAGVPFSSIQKVSPSLEDVFVALIQEEGGAVEG